MSAHTKLILLIHAVYAQFPEHNDLQKVGEIIFNNEKYNILKPTIHKITDHFEDFMLRRENKNKNERLLIDNNGFRHFWSGFGKRDNSLRKTELSLYEINKNINPSNLNKAVDDITRTDQPTIKKRPKRPKTSLELDEEEREILRQAAAKPAPVKPAAAPAAKPSVAAAKPVAAAAKPVAAAAKPAATAVKPAAATVKPAVPAAKPAVATAKPAAATIKAAAATAAKPAAASGGGKKIARVSFFCPFFGVMTMTSFIH